MPADLVELLRQPDWHLHDFDPASQSASLVKLDEALYHSASFLDQRVAPAAHDRMQQQLPDVQRALAEVTAPRDPGFIFHLGHCGSTLLSRALAVPGAVLPVREPLTLRRLAAMRAAGTDTGSWHNLLDTSVSAHARVFHPGELAVVKATSTCNGLVEPLLEARSGVRAVALYVTLEVYLAGLLGKQTPAQDLRGHAAARLADWAGIDGAPGLDAATLSEAALATLAWLTGFRHLLQAANVFPGRVQLLDFQVFLDSPEECLAQAGGFLGVGAALPQMLAQWPDVAMGYSKKPDEPYSAFDRRRTMQRGRINRSNDIRAGLDWAKTVVRELEPLRACAPYLA